MQRIKLKIDNQPLTSYKNPAVFAQMFQGFLMSKIDSDFAISLHDSNYSPYSIFSYYENDEIIFEINTFTEEADKKIIDDFLMSDNFSEFKLTKANKNFLIKSKQFEKIEVKNLASIFYKKLEKDIITLNFQSPTAFKSKGSYIFYPNEKLILQNIAMKYAYFFDGEKEIGEEIIEAFEKSFKVTSYNIRSKYMQIEKIKIPAFIGSVSFKIVGADTLKQYINMLLHFAEFSGVGVKTTMGMGMMRVRSSLSHPL